ncbi:MAG: CRISPR-associated endonuclease Cas1 [Acidobacteriota bacterium]
MTISRLSVEFSRYLVTLRLRRAARFHFNHGGVLRGLLSAALKRHELPVGLVPFACESGRTAFEPGDEYRIGLTFAGESRAEASAVIDGVRRVGEQSAASQAAAPVLGGNYDVESVVELPRPDLSAPVATAASSRLTLQLVSPLRLERPLAEQVKGARHLNASCFPVDHFLARLWNRLFLLAHGRYPERTEREQMPPLPLEARSDPTRLLWLDVPIDSVSERDPDRPRGYTLGGVVGRVVFRGITLEWIPIILLGQHLHTGENTHFGFGRYCVVTGAAQPSDPFRPARSALDRASAEDILDQSLDHVLSSSEAAGVDGVTPEDFGRTRERQLAALSASLRDGGYAPDRLAGFVSQDRDGKPRPLAVATVRDRVAQRAACMILGQSIDSLLEDCSYAYRKGFSRRGAATAIAKAYDEGFRYVLDADISSFFDTVEWPRLFAKLHALFPEEPLVELVEKWVRAPVVFQGRVIERTKGLPQGSPVAPLLANLYLDELDEELLGKDYRLVRYADDFVVLCKDLESAHAAREEAQKALEHLGLSLHPEKTGIKSFDSGFTYLGYLFCRSVVVESDSEADGAEQESNALRIPPSSWLAQVPLAKVRSLEVSQRPGRARRLVQVVSLGDQPAIHAPGPKPLYVLGPSSRVSVESGCMVAVGPDGKAQNVPLRSISHVTPVGRTRATLPLLMRLAASGVPVYICRRTGELISTMTPQQPDWSVWEAQGRFVRSPDGRAAFAREVVAAKLSNSAALCVRFKLDGGEEAAGEMREMAASCANKTDVEAMRGLEGRGAALFFSCLRRSISDDWGFCGRRAHPAPDPVNAMLSFGYTLLYNHLSTSLLAAGLNPRIGIFHASRGAYHALACDLQEEFRHLVDSLVWAMLSRREAKPADFVMEGGDRGRCLMSDELRREFIRRAEERLLTTFRPAGEQETIGYRAFMDRQAAQVRDLVTVRRTTYSPLRIRP